MRGTIVGVLRGGPSKEHEVSLNTGAAILKNLDIGRYTAKDIYIDKQGNWHVHGRPATPHEALRSVDVVIVGLHGEYGEDGEVQKILERYGIPYTGSDSFASYLAMHKVMAKERARALGVLTPEYRYVENEGQLEEVLADVIRNFHQPVVVKPVRWGSSVGVSMVSGYAPLHSTVQKLLRDGAGGVLIEEVIKGREATQGIVQDMRGEKLYALPSIEIIPPGDDFFSYGAKYSGETREICPAHFSKKEQEELARISRVMHEGLGLRHYSRSDFIISPKGIYYLETNTLPGMTSESLLPKALAAVGISYPDFLSHLVDLSLTGV